MPCHAGISTGVGCKRTSPARRIHLQEDIFVRPEIIVAGDSDGFQVELGVSNNLVVIVKSKPGWFFGWVPVIINRGWSRSPG